MERKSGVLMPMSSLPSRWGIGTMGKSAYQFVDFLKAAGQKYWQLLPLGPTSYGDSPYSAFSTFAGNPYYIDLDLLVKEGLLKPGEVKAPDWGEDPERVDYAKIYFNRFGVLRRAFERGREPLAEEAAAFRRENGSWLENYALYMAVKNHFGMVSWTEWPDEEIRLHHPRAVAEYGETLRENVEFWVFLQFLFFRQWQQLRSYAHEQGIEFIGDLPIYVALDSADVWANPALFQLDEDLTPTAVAGCPPDQFNEDGQLWGNPLYDWQAMADTGYSWWLRRLHAAARMYDVVRLDHFRGFESYWAVPYGAPDAREGEWRPGPGMEFIQTVRGALPELSFIAEDLGFLTPEVLKLREDSGFPGMKVLEFAFEPQEPSQYLPHRYDSRCVCYTGTHDNAPLKQWYDEIPEEERDFAKKYLALTEREGIAWGVIRGGMGSVAELFMAQMQDYLPARYSARMNEPGVVNELNWRWRLVPEAVNETLIRRIREITERYGRLPAADETEAGASGETAE